MFSSKKAKQFDMASLILIGLVVYVIWAMGLFGGVQKQAAGDQAGGTADSVIKVVGAPCTQATTLTASVLRRYTDDPLTAQNVTVYQNGVRKSAIAHGSTTTVQSGPNADLLDLYVGEESTTYYTQHVRGKLDTCTGSATTGDPSFKFVQDASVGGTPITYSDGANKIVLIADGFTITMTNDGESEAQSPVDARSGNNLSISTGGTASVSIQFKPDYNEGVGVIGGNILACQYPNTKYDATAPISFTFAGKVLDESSIDVPTSVLPLVNTSFSTKKWKLPGMDGRLTPTIDVSAILRASSTSDPGTADFVNCTILDTDYYVKDADGSLVLDIVNRDDNTDLGGANNVYDFLIKTE